jgi:hypothetical protein
VTKEPSEDSRLSRLVNQASEGATPSVEVVQPQAESNRTPPLTVVTAVIAALQAHGVVAAVGGSGLLAALGLINQVRDWDVSCDAPTETVEAALHSTGLRYTRAVAGDGQHATRARFAVVAEDHEVDVLVGFAIRDGGHVIPLPTRVTSRWRGLPMADPTVWLTAYRLLGRHQRADCLDAWLDESTGSSAPVVSQEPSA